MAESLVAGVGWSAHSDAARAGKEAVERARGRLPQGPRLAVVLGSSWLNQNSLLEGVASTLGTTPIVGGSTAGEIIPDGPTSHTCCVLLLASDGLACGVGVGGHVNRGPRETGQRAAYRATKNFPGNKRTAFLMFGDGLVTSYAEVTRGIQEVLGTGSMILGGLTGDDMRFSRTTQYAGKRALSNAVVGVLLGGNVNIGVGLEHGFAPISKPRHITRAQANVLMELDRKPAKSVYEEYFGQDLVRQMQHEALSRQGIAYPLGIQCATPDKWLLRRVISFQDDGSLACNGEVPEKAWLQLMIGSRDLALEAARRAAQQATASLNHVAAVIVFDSILRRTLFGQQYASTEIASIREAVGHSVPLIGCYTYGEQGPLTTMSTSGKSAMQTGSILVIAMGT